MTITESRYPLTFGQLSTLRSLLSRPDMSDPQTPRANLFFLVHAGAADLVRVTEALHVVEERHASLRSVLTDVRSTSPQQEILPVQAADPDNLDADLDEWQTVARSAHEATRFPLEGAPLWHPLMLRDRHRRRTAISISISHIIADEWAIQILREEIGSILRGEELAPAPQVHEVAVQERAEMGRRTRRAITHWQEQIGSVELEPADYADITSYESARRPLTAQHTERMRELRGSPTSVLVHAYTALLDTPQLLCLVASNRVTAADRRLVSSMNQAAVLRVNPLSPGDLADTSTACLRAFSCARFDPDALQEFLPEPLTATGGGMTHVLNVHFSGAQMPVLPVGGGVSRWEVPLAHGYPSYVRAFANEEEIQVVWGVSARGRLPRTAELLDEYQAAVGPSSPTRGTEKGKPCVSSQ